MHENDVGNINTPREEYKATGTEAARSECRPAIRMSLWQMHLNSVRLTTYINYVV